MIHFTFATFSLVSKKWGFAKLIGDFHTTLLHCCTDYRLASDWPMRPTVLTSPDSLIVGGETTVLPFGGLNEQKKNAHQHANKAWERAAQHQEGLNTGYFGLTSKTAFCLPGTPI